MFQSTPPRGRRPSEIERAFQLDSFQSTPPRGRRPSKSLRLCTLNSFQSTPPRGRRQQVRGLHRDRNQFQSTPPRGRRLVRRAELERVQCFNPRLREGGDSPSGYFYIVSYGFNPRLREGGDIDGVLSECRASVSIHASAREATSQNLTDQRIRNVSIHASAREATRNWLLEPLLGRVSIHASAREATLTSTAPRPTPSFQSTPPRGRRHGCK